MKFLWFDSEMEDVLKSADDRTAALQADLRTLRDTQDRIGALQNESVLFLLAAIEDEDKTDAVPASWNPVSDGVPLHLSDLKVSSHLVSKKKLRV